MVPDRGDIDKGIDELEAAKRAVKRMLQEEGLSKAQQEELERMLRQLEDQQVRLQDREDLVSELQARVHAYEEKFEEIKEPPLLCTATTWPITRSAWRTTTRC